MRWRGVCLCLSVCKLFCGNRYYDAKNNSIATKLAYDNHPVGAHPCCAQGRGQGQRSRDTSAFVPIIKIAFSRRQMARLRPNLHTMVPRSARVQDVFKVEVKVKGHVLQTLLRWHEKTLLPGKWPDCDQTCTRWSPGRASRMCPVSRSRSKVT